MNFKLESLANFEFLGVSNSSTYTVHEVTKFRLHFQLKLKQEGTNNDLYRPIISEISEELLINKNKLSTAFGNGFF